MVDVEKIIKMDRKARVTGLLTVGFYLGKDKMFSQVHKEEANRIWRYLNTANVNTNIYDQFTAKSVYETCLEVRSLGASFGHELLNSLCDYCFSVSHQLS